MSALSQLFWLQAAAGIWMIIAPFVLGYNGDHAAVRNDAIVGTAMALVGIFGAVRARLRHESS